jgi:hypothetical protein
MDTRTGELVQVVDTESEKAALQAAEITEKVLTQAEVNTENAKRETEGEGKIEQIARQPKKNCRHCYGRGHMGKNLVTGRYVPCYCVEEPDHKKSRLYQEYLASRLVPSRLGRK